MHKEREINISKGMRQNKLVYIIQATNVGRIFVPNSIPSSLLPYLAVVEKERKKR